MVQQLARLVLEDGTVFRGRSVGATGTTTGEAVFNTGLTGYQEVLTDPSYRGQIVTMTYPEIGNYGCNDADMESGKAQAAGFVMRQCCLEPSSFRAQESLPDFLRRWNIVAIDGIDTRALTRKLRVSGCLRSVLSSEAAPSDAELIAQAQAIPSMAGLDLASAAGTDRIYEWTEPVDPGRFGGGIPWAPLSPEAHVVCIDLGIKRNILRLLRSCGFRVTVVPSRTTAAEIRALQPDGVFISNGPGDPAAVQGATETIRALTADDLPIFGICLGHQLIALALGARTYKLKFGHRGANHPIQRHEDGAVEIASHNHGFAVDLASIPAHLEVTHMNINDQTCAGLRHRDKPVFCVQYHPEACPGPSDPLYLFQRFADLVAKHRRR